MANELIYIAKASSFNRRVSQQNFFLANGAFYKSVYKFGIGKHVWQIETVVRFSDIQERNRKIVDFSMNARRKPYTFRNAFFGISKIIATVEP